MDLHRAVLRSALGRPDIRRVELAYVGFNLAEYGVWVAVLVYAYERGGTGAAALLAVAQLLPAATLAPILARRIDRRGPGAALWQGYLAQAITLSATAGLLLAGGPPGRTPFAQIGVHRARRIVPVPSAWRRAGRVPSCWRSPAFAVAQCIVWAVVAAA
jgi:hypothetical protein